MLCCTSATTALPLKHCCCSGDIHPLPTVRQGCAHTQRSTLLGHRVQNMSLRECNMQNSNHLKTPPCSPTSGTIPEEQPLIGISTRTAVFCLCLLPHFSLPGKSCILSPFEFSLNLSRDSTAKKALTCSHETSCILREIHFPNFYLHCPPCPSL